MPPRAVQVNLWWVDLNPPDVSRPDLARRLDARELQRLARFRFDADARRYAAAHAALRLILARELGQPPAQVAYVIHPSGKPRLASGSREFNLSHSGDMALIATTASVQVGVDVEAPRSLPDFADIAARFFSPGERSVVERSDAGWTPLAFYRCWTRKEAFVKGIGQGLACPLDQFDVSIGPRARLRKVAWDPRAVTAWQLRDVSRNDYIAALAVESERVRVRVQAWNWQSG